MPPRFQKNKEDRSRNASGQSSTDSASNTTDHNSPVHYLPSALNPPGIPSVGPKGSRGGGQGHRSEYNRYQGGNQRVNGYNNGNYRGGGFGGDVDYRRGYEHSGQGYEQNSRSYDQGHRGYDQRGYDSSNRGYGQGMDRRGRRGYNNYRGGRGGRGGGIQQYVQPTDTTYFRADQSQNMPNLMVDGYSTHETPIPSIPVADILPPGQYVAPPPLMSMATAVPIQQSEILFGDQFDKRSGSAGSASTDSKVVDDQGEGSGGATPPEAQTLTQEALPPSVDGSADLEVVDIVPGEASIPLTLATQSVMTDMGAAGVPMQSPDMQNYYQMQPVS